MPILAMMLSVLTGGSWLGSKVGNTLVIEDNKIKDTAKKAVTSIKTYVVLGVVAWVAFVFWKKR